MPFSFYLFSFFPRVILLFFLLFSFWYFRAIFFQIFFFCFFLSSFCLLFLVVGWLALPLVGLAGSACGWVG
jgi:hypothetical protein